MRLSFDIFDETLGVIPCVVTLEKKSGGYVVAEIDASDHDGGELSSHLLERIEEKATEMAGEMAGDIADRLYDERRDASLTEHHAPPLTAQQNYEDNAEAKGWK